MKNKKNDYSDTLWAVRGVSQEAKNAAKIAAKKSATSLGVWLSRKIIEAAQTELTEKSRAITRQEDVFDILENLSNKFDKDLSGLRGQIEEMKSQKRPWLQSLFNKHFKS